jgi:DNA-directed RNA polymerase subunit alpha
MIQLNWTELIKPTKIKKERRTETDTYSKFIIEPFERGYATTIGNSLRRVLLSSIIRNAIVSFKIENVIHEFQVIEGVYEDINQIIMNLKAIRFKCSDTEIKRLHLVKKGPCDITAKDFETDSSIKILNPEQPVVKLTGKIDFDMWIDVAYGHGYNTAEDNKKYVKEIGFIPIDSIFSPVTKVRFSVDEDINVFQDKISDRLILEIFTDGSIKPEDALAYSAKIIKEYCTIFINFKEEEIQIKVEKKEKVEDKQRIRMELKKNIYELELSKRPANCLKRKKIETIAKLVSLTPNQLINFKNFGAKSLNEIKEKLAQRKLFLGMNIKEYLEEEEQDET